MFTTDIVPYFKEQNKNDNVQTFKILAFKAWPKDQQTKRSLYYIYIYKKNLHTKNQLSMLICSWEYNVSPKIKNIEWPTDRPT